MSGVLVLAAAIALAAPPSEKDILGGAEARIRQHRTGEAVLRVLDGEGRPLPEGTEVRIEQTRHEFLFGCNIFILGRVGSPEDNAAYEKLFGDLLNYATLPFYWWAYEAAPGEPDYARTRELAGWCAAHHIRVKGHPLAWNFYDPKWIPADTELARSLQTARIFREVNRFRGTVDLWDVVNEATAYDRPECQKNSPVLTRCIRERGVGPFVRQAFAAARAANPEARLVINDYRIGDDYAAKVIRELVDEQGRPLYDVIGIQSHQHGGPWPVGQVWEVCDRFAAFGKPLHFTETTFVSGKRESIPGGNPDFRWDSTPEGERAQAEQAATFYTVLFSHPAVQAITWWDFADRKAWQGAPAGLIGRDLKPKPAYEALKGLIKGKWWTKTAARVAGDGRVQFRGFYGDYRVTAGPGDRPGAGTVTLQRSAAGPIEVRLK